MYVMNVVQVMAAQAEWEESVKDAVQADDEGAEYDPVFEARSAALDASATLLKTMKEQLQACLPLIIAHNQPVSVLDLSLSQLQAGVLFSAVPCAAGIPERHACKQCKGGGRGGNQQHAQDHEAQRARGEPNKQVYACMVHLTAAPEQPPHISNKGC